ncbi:MAG TPA: hypothetical protein EYQ00_14200 [Dehalococcoidia bacterium]|nr:hypothetical protein [Dehalococcoidia bacterium]
MMNAGPFRILISLLLLSSPVFAQEKEYDYKKTAEERKRGRAFKNNFFTQSSRTYFTHLIESPYTIQTNIDRDGEMYQESYNESHFALFDYAFETRYNLFNFRDYLSVSTSVPVQLALTVPWQSSGGVGHLILPVYLDLNLFAHSTYNSIDNIGFFAGVGKQQVWGTLLGGEHQSWNELVFRGGVKYPSRGRLSFFMVEYGQGEIIEYVDRNGLGKKRQAWSLRISIGRCFNYEVD